MYKGVFVIIIFYLFLMGSFISDIGEIQSAWVIDGDFIRDAGIILGIMLILPYILGFIDGRD